MSSGELDVELAGLDALDLPSGPRPDRLARLWSAVWPRVAAVAGGLALWQLVAWSGWRPSYVLPGPAPVLSRVVADLFGGDLIPAVVTTLRRAVVGYAIAVVIGGFAGAAVSRVSALRAAFGTLFTGLQSMPSIAWFPFAILLFRLSEQAILVVVVLGAAPSVASGVLAAADHVPPLLVRSGRVLGARGVRLYRHVVFPAGLPSIVSGLKQAWAFAWRSLMAGELIVIVAGRSSLGQKLQFMRELSDATGLIAVMLVVLLVGLLVDGFVFGVAERSIRVRRGLLQTD